MNVTQECVLRPVPTVPDTPVDLVPATNAAWQDDIALLSSP
jgi:hypothetical protein